MNTYELTFLFPREKSSVPAQLEGYLTTAKAKKVKKDDWGVKDLAYPIQDMKEAHYLHFVAQMSSSGIKSVEEKVKLNEDIVRHLIVKKD